MAYSYKYYHDFDCGHRQRTNSYDTWQWMRGQLLCKSCAEEQNRMADSIAPPVGLRPPDVWNAEVRRLRAVEITQAMQRYATAGEPIPREWIKELNKQLRKA